MGQINVNPPSNDGDRTAAAGINMVTVMIVLLVLLVLVWFLFVGPGRGFLGGVGGPSVNPPAQQQPAAPEAPKAPVPTLPQATAAPKSP